MAALNRRTDGPNGSGGTPCSPYPFEGYQSYHMINGLMGHLQSECHKATLASEG